LRSTLVSKIGVAAGHKMYKPFDLYPNEVWT
jgi:hypothetical protein